MAVWLIRAGKHGEDEDAAIESGQAIIGWKEMPDVCGVLTYEALKCPRCDGRMRVIATIIEAKVKMQRDQDENTQLIRKPRQAPSHRYTDLYSQEVEEQLRDMARGVPAGLKKEKRHDHQCHGHRRTC